MYLELISECDSALIGGWARHTMVCHGVLHDVTTVMKEPAESSLEWGTGGPLR